MRLTRGGMASGCDDAVGCAWLSRRVAAYLHVGFGSVGVVGGDMHNRRGWRIGMAIAILLASTVVMQEAIRFTGITSVQAFKETRRGRKRRAYARSVSRTAQTIYSRYSTARGVWPLPYPTSSPHPPGLGSRNLGRGETCTPHARVRALQALLSLLLLLVLALGFRASHV